MRRAHKLISALVLSLGLALGGIFSVAPGANAASISQAYYLFYSRIKSIQANCAGTNRYISYHGVIKLRHDRTWRTVLHSQSSGGDLVTETYWRKGFSTAYQEEYCRKGDFVWEFFGAHKVLQVYSQIWFCNAGSCAFLFSKTSAWRSYNWA